MINRLADTSAQIRIRLSVLLVVGLGALATHLGFEAILGAFIAGAILRLVDADAERKHPLFHPKLDAIGYGFLIPVFFVTGKTRSMKNRPRSGKTSAPGAHEISGLRPPCRCLASQPERSTI
jgi:hypothetical protein